MKKILVTLILFLSVPMVVIAQTSEFEKDSILSAISQSGSIEKMDGYNRLFDYYHSKNLFDSAKYFNELLRLEAEQVHSESSEAKYHNNSGILLTSGGKYYEAIEKFQTALKTPGISDSDRADYYNNLAGAYYYLGDFKKVLNYTFKSYKIYEKIQKHNDVVMTMNHIGMIYKNLREYRKALSYYRAALLYADNHHLYAHQAKLFQNIAIAYKYEHKPDSCLYFLKKALAAPNSLPSGIDKTLVYLDLGNLFAFDLGQLDSAWVYLRKAEKKAFEPDTRLRIWMAFSKIHSMSNDYSNSIRFLNKALSIAEKQNSWENLQWVHYYLYRNYKSIKRWDSAIYHLENFVDYQDSIKLQDAKVQIENLSAKYENEKHKLKIEKLELENIKNRKIKGLLLAGLLMSVVIFSLIIRSFRLHRKKNLLASKLLQAEKEKIQQDLQHKTKELTTQALMILEKNNLLEEILKSLSSIQTTNIETRKELSEIKQRLRKSLKTEKDWELFKQYFEQVNKDFFGILKKINPKISPAELKLAALIRLRFSIKESASLLGVSTGTIKTARYELRKKLGLKRKDNLYDFLNQI